MTDKIRNIILVILFILCIISTMLVATLVEIVVYIAVGVLIFSSIAAFFILHWDWWFGKKK